ncbi:MAG: hypothetical protein A3C62_02555 [Candidatus Zambryskibacteria bacterium RIFCSPHIGHO2_02_FULL_39_16]|nr:MAG: hypothetical protein A3C62_02555 [Candidatus Zambryskibacteria bacterium RIFCSPHIGHO2_02_FULL_39_16]
MGVKAMARISPVLGSIIIPPVNSEEYLLVIFLISLSKNASTDGSMVVTISASGLSFSFTTDLILENISAKKFIKVLS